MYTGGHKTNMMARQHQCKGSNERELNRMWKYVSGGKCLSLSEVEKHKWFANVQSIKWCRGILILLLTEDCYKVALSRFHQSWLFACGLHWSYTGLLRPLKTLLEIAPDAPWHILEVSLKAFLTSVKNVCSVCLWWQLRYWNS